MVWSAPPHTWIPQQIKSRNSTTPVVLFHLFSLFSLIFFQHFRYGFSRLDEVCEKCDSLALRLFNKSFSSAFENSFNPSKAGTITLKDFRPGLCEATFLISNGKVSAHLASAGFGENARGGELNSVYLRHKEFFVVLLKVLKTSERILNVKTPDLLFNFETHDNPTCKYPSSEVNSQQIIPVKGVIHHSFCSPKLCNGTVLLPISYNQDFEALESTKALDTKASRIPWKDKTDILFWRGSNAGKLQEYEYFDWNLPDSPRKHAVKMCKLRKDIDVSFGFVPWKTFMKYKYHLALAGNTYSSLFKHALRSGSCILRQEERMYEWFEPFVQEWIHFIP